jgi:hypothetical protein
VLIGLYLSYRQFELGTKDGTPVTSIKISSAGLKVSSPVIGLIVLLLSFVFLRIHQRGVSDYVRRPTAIQAT